MSGAEETDSSAGLSGAAKVTGIIGGFITILLGLNALIGWNPLNDMFSSSSGDASPTPLATYARTATAAAAAVAADRTGCKEALQITRETIPELEGDLGPVHAHAVEQAAQLRAIARKATNTAVASALQTYGDDWDSLGSAVRDYEEKLRQTQSFVDEAERYMESAEKHDEDVTEFNQQQEYYESLGDIQNATIAHNKAVAAYEKAQTARDQASTFTQKAKEEASRGKAAVQRMETAFHKLRANASALEIACD